MNNTVFVAGVGMTPFVKPGTEAPYTEMGAHAVRMALEDAGLDYGLIQQAYAGYVYGDSTCGQAVLYGVGMTGIPVINVNNNCSTGSTPPYLARQAVESGVVECALALGFEQMVRGALVNVFNDRPAPLGKFVDMAEALQGHSDSPMAIRLFGGAGSRVPRTLRHPRRDLRHDRGQSPPPRAVKRARDLPPASHRGRGAGLAQMVGVLTRDAVLPADLRRGRGRGLHARTLPAGTVWTRTLRSSARPWPPIFARLSTTAAG